MRAGGGGGGGKGRLCVDQEITVGELEAHMAAAGVLRAVGPMPTDIVISRFSLYTGN